MSEISSVGSGFVKIMALPLLSRRPVRCCYILTPRKIPCFTPEFQTLDEFFGEEEEEEEQVPSPHCV